MKMICEWSPRQVLRFFRCGGRINASQFQAMDEPTREAFEVLYARAEEERVARITEALTASIMASVGAAAAPEETAVEDSEPDSKFPLKLGGD